MKFVASYSGGKDCVLAIYRAILAGLQPIALIIAYNDEKNRSWFHGIPESVLNSLSISLEIPIWIVKTSGENYSENFENALKKARFLGAESCVFGDIDIEKHRDWCIDRCEAAGLIADIPLWGAQRKRIVKEFIEAGFIANFTVINTDKMSDSFLGQKLTQKTIAELEQQGVDSCGENGEFHTFVWDGPIFNAPVNFTFGEKIIENNYAIMPIWDTN